MPNDWATSTDSQIQTVREAANSDINKNQIKKIYIENAGDNYGNNLAGEHIVDILGDGTGAKALVIINNSGEISDVRVTSGGYGYTYGMVDLSSINSGAITNNTPATLIPIIPPSKGHGYDVYTELGADKVLIYARFDDSSKDFPIDTQFAQVGIVKNPSQFNSTGITTSSQFSSLYSIKLKSPITTVADTDKLVGAAITQTRSVSAGGGTAKGYVASYDKDTNVLKYFQDRSLYLNNSNKANHQDYRVVDTESKVLTFDSGGSNVISVTSGANFSVGIDSNFSGITTVIDSKQINLGVNFTSGLANPEINKKTGDIIYIDNRKMVKRDVRQKEDVKIILEF